VARAFRAVSCARKSDLYATLLAAVHSGRVELLAQLTNLEVAQRGAGTVTRVPRERRTVTHYGKNPDRVEDTLPIVRPGGVMIGKHLPAAILLLALGIALGEGGDA
jgi:hypothetical protein